MLRLALRDAAGGHVARVVARARGAYDQGRIRALGVSNFAPSQLRELLEWARVGPHLVQSWMDPLHQERALRRLCAAHGVQFQAYSSLGTQHAGRTGGANPVLKHPAVAALAEEAGRAPAQVVLRWALQKRGRRRHPALDQAAPHRRQPRAPRL